MNGQKNCFIALLLLLLLLCGGAMAQQEVEIDQVQARLLAEDDWVVLTRDNLGSQADLLQKRGTSAQALLSAYESSHIYAEVFSSGCQVTLYAVDVSASSLPAQYSQLAYAQRSDFLTYVARMYQYESGAFTKELPMFALFQKKEESAGVTLYTKSLITLRYHRLYILEVVSVGQEMTPEADAFLQSTAAALAFLGEKPAQAAAEEAKQLSLPESTYAPEMAEVRITQDAVPVALTFTPATWDNLYLTVTGTTTPDTALRYYLNGEGGERLTSDETGAFSCEIKFPKNGHYNVSIQAISGQDRGAAAFTVDVTRAEAPVALAATEITTPDESATLRGIALPGATVTLITSSNRETQVTVAEDGTFTLDLSAPREDTFTFTVKVQSAGYAASNTTVAYTRIASPQQAFDEQAASALPLTYAQALLSENEGALVLLSGSITGFATVPEGCAYLLSAEAGTYLVLTDSLYDLHLSQQKTILALVAAAPAGQTLPTVELIETRP